jgi:hypothetical protein
MDYTTLVGPKSTPGSLASWSNYGLAPASDVLTDAQSLIYMTLRVREMLSDAVPIAVGLGVNSVALPADFLDPIDLRNAFGQKLPHKDAIGVMNRRTYDAAGVPAVGQPGVYAIFGEKMQFDVVTNAATTLSLIYFQTPAALSPTNTTNFLTRRYPNLLRTACLAVAADFRKHEADYNRNVQRMTTLITTINAENDLYLRGVEVDADWRNL